jgi:copper chaperone NosL
MKSLIILSLIVLFTLSACQSQIDLDQPPDIRYGEDICEECNMIISEPRFAAAYYTGDGDARIFDDIGGMAIHHAEHQEDAAQFWVHDYKTETWIIADQAYFVMSDNLQTPMGHGVVAFSERKQAENLVSEVGGMLMTFTEVLTSFGSGSESHSHSDP